MLVCARARFLEGHDEVSVDTRGARGDGRWPRSRSVQTIRRAAPVALHAWPLDRRDLGTTLGRQTCSASAPRRAAWVG
jgi:hypothetical protein